MFLYLAMIDTEEDKSKFEKIYEEYRSGMYRIALQVLNNREDAENIVHDAFVVLIDHLDKIDKIYDYRTWGYLASIVRSRAINYYNREKRKVSFAPEDYDGWDSDDKDPLYYVVADEKEKTLVNFISELPYPQKDVIYLQYVNELKSKEIAEILELTPENVRQLSRRAKLRLKALLEEKED